MAQHMPPPGARLMLVFTLTPDLSADRALAAARAGDVAAMVLRVPENGGAATTHLKAVADAVQGAGIAVLVDGPDALVTAAGLDGVHVSEPSRLAASLKALKPASIVGAGGVITRHDAMVAGESGADYVFFGALAPGADEFTRTLDLVRWWVELFEVPAVGLASSLDEVDALAAAGADFVALAEPLHAGAADVVAAAQARVDAAGGAP